MWKGKKLLPLLSLIMVGSSVVGSWILRIGRVDGRFCCRYDELADIAFVVGVGSPDRGRCGFVCHTFGIGEGHADSIVCKHGFHQLIL